MVRREIPKRADQLPCRVHWPDFETYVQTAMTADGVVFWTPASFLIGIPSRSPYNALHVAGIVTAWGCSDGKQGMPLIKLFEDWCRERGIGIVETHLPGPGRGEVLKRLGYEVV